jgi:hypothetical protein
MRIHVIAIGVVCAGLASSASAQVQDRPARPYEGLFGGGRATDRTRTQHELSLNTSLLGGYDDFGVSESGGLPPGSGAQRGNGTSGFIESGLRYAFIQSTRSVTAEGRGYFNSYSSGEPTVGGDATVSGTTRVGMRNQLSASGSARNEPFFSIGEFGALAQSGEAVLPGNDPTLGGLSEERFWTLSSSASFGRGWTARQTSAFAYNFSKSDAPSTVGYDSTTHTASLSHSWQFSRSAGFQGGYSFGKSSVETGAAPMTSHTFDAGFDYTRRLSATRSMGFTGRLGASYIEAIPTADQERGAYWAPSAQGTVRIDIGRSWAVGASYSRSATVLDRIAVRTFYSDAMTVNAGGSMGRRFDATMSAGLARGDAGSQGGEARYSSYTATAQLRAALARCCATFVSYSYYDYTLSNFTLQQGVPPQSTQNGVRVGFSIWLPIVGGNARTGGPR